MVMTLHKWDYVTCALKKGPQKWESLEGGSILKGECECTVNHPTKSLVLEIIQFELEPCKEEQRRGYTENKRKGIIQTTQSC